MRITVYRATEYAQRVCANLQKMGRPYLDLQKAEKLYCQTLALLKQSPASPNSKLPSIKLALSQDNKLLIIVNLSDQQVVMTEKEIEPEAGRSIGPLTAKQRRNFSKILDRFLKELNRFPRDGEFGIIAPFNAYNARLQSLPNVYVLTGSTAGVNPNDRMDAVVRDVNAQILGRVETRRKALSGTRNEILGSGCYQRIANNFFDHQGRLLIRHPLLTRIVRDQEVIKALQRFSRENGLRAYDLYVQAAIGLTRFGAQDLFPNIKLDVL